MWGVMQSVIEGRSMFIKMFRRKSRAERVQERLSRGEKPSAIAVKVTGKMTSARHNKIMKVAVTEYNVDHKRKVFVE